MTAGSERNGPTAARPRRRVFRFSLTSLASAGLVALLAAPPAFAQAAADAERIKRGERLFHAGGCRNCHADPKRNGKLLAGGPPIKTAFGIFYGPNITPHPERGIGRWSDADFIRAMRKGVSPSGDPYYPAFPYTSFTYITDADLLDLKAYIFSLPPADTPSRPHELGFPFNIRAGLHLWRMLFFREGPFRPDPARSAQWNRGAYLVEALAHCGECHTPRNFAGALDRDRWMAGTDEGPDGTKPPNITPAPESGIGKWREDEIVEALEFGILPDGDEFGSLMADVVTHGTSKLSDADRRAIAVYLRALPPVGK